MSDEALPDETWENVADSWRVDELVEGRIPPSTNDDVATLTTVGILRSQAPLDETARRHAFDATMAAADRNARADEAQKPRDPARIEQTRQETMRAYMEEQQREE